MKGSETESASYGVGTPMSTSRLSTGGNSAVVVDGAVAAFRRNRCHHGRLASASRREIRTFHHHPHRRHHRQRGAMFPASSAAKPVLRKRLSPGRWIGAGIPRVRARAHLVHRRRDRGCDRDRDCGGRRMLLAPGLLDCSSGTGLTRRPVKNIEMVLQNVGSHGIHGCLALFVVGSIGCWCCWNVEWFDVPWSQQLIPVRSI